MFADLFPKITNIVTVAIEFTKNVILYFPHGTIVEFN